MKFSIWNRLNFFSKSFYSYLFSCSKIERPIVLVVKHLKLNFWRRDYQEITNLISPLAIISLPTRSSAKAYPFTVDIRTRMTIHDRQCFFARTSFIEIPYHFQSSPRSSSNRTNLTFLVQSEQTSSVTIRGPRYFYIIDAFRRTSLSYKKHAKQIQSVRINLLSKTSWLLNWKIN